MGNEIMAATRTFSEDSDAERLLPPQDSVTVRMYRIGHGDCFLLAFPAETPEKPCYVLIDCGYKPGSPKFLKATPAEVAENIKAATGGFVDVVMVTHEHQDHVNAFTESNFKDIRFGECWFAWTEDPNDAQANALRERFKDRLLTLVQARQRLALAEKGSSSETARSRVEDFLSFELGGEEETLALAAAGNSVLPAAVAENSQNKRAMKLVRTLAGDKVRYLRPHDEVLSLPGVAAVKVFTLGPPKDEALLHSMDPEGDESFHGLAFSAHSEAGYFAAALTQRGEEAADSPFARRYRVGWDEALDAGAGQTFWHQYYDGTKGAPSPVKRSEAKEVESAPPWRRIDHDWLHASEQLALDMNNDTNNGSLVVAFELEPGGKVLLFAADAQRGNWISWDRGTWKDGEREVTAQSLLARTVLYKVGHHGSHNATLDGGADSGYASLGWMGQGEYGGEFTAMITAVRPWAETQKGWDHPLKAIKDALLEKAAGRVFQTDTGVDGMQCRGPEAVQQAFNARVRDSLLYVDYDIPV